MLNKKKGLVHFILSFFLIFFFIEYSPSLLSKFEPDSYSYINFTEYRKSLYGQIFKILEDLKFDIIFVQKLFLALSISFLYFCISKKINIFLSYAYLFLIILNFYYTGFSKTLITESFFFSFINFSLAIFLVFEKFNQQSILYYFLAGLCFGFLLAIKSIGIMFGLFFFLLMFFLKKEKNFFFVTSLFCGFLVLPTFEQIIFYSKNDNRSSVLPQAIIGKTFMLSGKKHFDYNDFPDQSNLILKKASIKFSEINVFLQNIKNPFLRADLAADYEVVAQYQFFRNEINVINKNLASNSKKFEDGFMQSIINNHLADYISMSFFHYIGLWSSGSKYLFLNSYLDQNNIQAPFKKKLDSSSGNIKEINKNLLFCSFLFFITLLSVFLFVTLVSAFFILKQKYRRDYYFEISLLFFTQAYLICVSFLNVATPRYLMPVYPIIILIIMFYLDKFFQFIKKDNIDFLK